MSLTFLNRNLNELMLPNFVANLYRVEGENSPGNP